MPPIVVTGWERVEDGVALEYLLPGNPANNDPLYGGHTHMIPDGAVWTRQTIYNVSVKDALEALVLEHLATWLNVREPGKLPTKAKRDEMRGAHPVVGAAFAQAAASIPPVSTEFALDFEQRLKPMLGDFAKYR